MPSIRPIREDADELVVAATHNGPFHADDVLAGALLLSMGPEITFIRTRDPEQIAEADVVFDVGGVHDPSTWRLDHHQFRSTEARVRSRFMPAVPLSSAGMTLEAMVDSGAMEKDVAEIVYRDLVAAIDLHDNGEAPPSPEGHPHGATLSGVLSRFNPNWDDEDKDFDAAFHRAVMWALDSLVLPAIASAESTLRAHKVVASAIKPGTTIAVLPVAVPGAREIVLDLDAEVDFLVHPSDFGGWMVMTVPPSREDAFSQRVPLPAEWAGLRGEELNAQLAKAGVRTDVLEAGIAANPSAVFTHTGRFCGGHGTKEAAIAMAMAAIVHKVKAAAAHEAAATAAAVAREDEIEAETGTLRLWHVTRTVGGGYDTYSDFVVVAATVEQARRVHPSDEYMRWDKAQRCFTYSDGSPSEAKGHGSWTDDVDSLEVVCVGNAVEGMEPGKVICASYHAG